MIFIGVIGFLALALAVFWLKLEIRRVSSDVFEKQGAHLKQLAEGALYPIQETMKQIHEHQRELERRREGTYSSLSKQIEILAQSEKDLRTETTRLTQALKSPQIRGSWGQVHLRRVVELAGLIEHCDFYEQKAIYQSGQLLRPDLIVHLPGNRQIVIDAKTPLHAHLESGDAEGESQRTPGLVHAIRRHMKDLSSKEYWKQFESAPEYVILFLPAEGFFSAALREDPQLIESAADLQIILAAPTTLIAILRAVALGWKQESLTKSVREIGRLGEELYDRLSTFCDHWSRMGKVLNSAVDAYNQSISSLESRVLVSARKLKEKGSLEKEIPDFVSLDKVAKNLKGPLDSKELE